MFDKLRANLTGAGFRTVQSIKEALLSDDKNASGSLINNTRFEIQDTGSLLSLLLKAPAHYKFVDEGRRPGATQPPTGKIAQWMKRKGITGSPFVIARAIGRKGIAPTNIYTDAVKKMLSETKIAQLAREDIQKASLEALQPSKIT